ncbi:PAS domain-containing protein [Pyruvatibacter mobilis]|uniref:PAS domain-containing protein n=1 Tax=Pyruvatibacter mobilis TaxID=1712261 RepID=UPI003BAD2F12
MPLEARSNQSAVLDARTSLEKSAAPGRLRAFLDLYDEMRDGRLVPHRNDLDLRKLSAFLTDLTLMEIEDEATITYRLMGSDVAERMGADLTGRNFLEFLSPKERRGTARAMDLIVSRPVGLFSIYLNQYARGVLSRNESIMLPLSAGDDDKVTQIIGLHLVQTTVNYATAGDNTIIAADTFGTEPVDLGNGVPTADEIARLRAVS